MSYGSPRTTWAMQRLWEAMAEGSGDGGRPALRWAPYVLVGLAVLIGLVARIAFEPVLGNRSAFLFFVPALLIGSALAGLRGGLVATALGAAAGLVLLQRYNVHWNVAVDAPLYAALGVAIALGGERLRTAQQQAVETHKHLVERDAYLQSLLNTVPDAMVVIEDHGLVQSFSPAAEKLFGWKSNEVVGRNVSMLMPTPD